MTIASQTSRISYTGDGGTATFAVPFYFQTNTDLVVYLQDTAGNQTLQVLGTNYNLTGATLSAGGSCIFTAAPGSGYLVTIYRDPPVTQLTSYNNNDPFPAKSHELALDKLTTLIQRLRDLMSRTFRISDGEGNTNTVLASIATRKGKLLGFDANGNLIYPLGPTFVASTFAGVAYVDTQATAAVTTFPGSVNVVRTGGRVTTADGLGGEFIRASGTSSGAFQDAGGQWWRPSFFPGGVAFVDTQATALNITFPASTNVVRTGGLATAGDGGGNEFIRGISTDFGAFHDAGGQYWKPSLPPAVASALDGPRGIPASWTPIGIRPVVTQKGAGPGKVTLNMTPQQYATYRNNNILSAPTRCYVDPDGDDTTGTGTSALPFATIIKAASTSTAAIVHVRAGTYAPPKLKITDAAFSGGRTLKQFFLEPGVTIAVAGPRLMDQTWVVHSGTVYKTTLTLTTNQTVQRVMRRDTYDLVSGQPLTFTQYANAAALVAATGQGWAIDTTSGNKVIYIRLTNGDNVNTFKSILKALYVDSNFESDWNVNGVPCLIQAVVPGTVLFDGVGIISTDFSGSTGEVYVDGIVSRFGLLSAFQTFGGINYFARCWAHAPVGDCFNYNASTALAASQNIELDCRGTNAGDIASFTTSVPPNRNYSSVHDFVDILRVGGFGENCWGPIVADIANAATGTSWNIGVICGSTTEPQNISFFGSDAGRSCFYDMCHAYGNTTALTAAAGVNRATGCNFEGAIVGTLTSYNPTTGA